jgi:hypothetical protein
MFVIKKVVEPFNKKIYKESLIDMKNKGKVTWGLGGWTNSFKT